MKLSRQCGENKDNMRKTLKKKHGPVMNINIAIVLSLVVSFNGAKVWLTAGWQWRTNQSTTWMSGIPNTICCLRVGHCTVSWTHYQSAFFIIWFEWLTRPTKRVLVKRAEYSVKMLMHHFMEIRHEAKRQQIYKHLFAFDVLPQTHSHFNPQSEDFTFTWGTCRNTQKNNTVEDGAVCMWLSHISVELKDL